MKRDKVRALGLSGLIISVFFALILILYSCSTQRVEIDYFAQPKPLDEALKFSPDFAQAEANWFWHSAPSFSPDGQHMFWSKFFRANQHIEIWELIETPDQETPISSQRVDLPNIEGEVNCPVWVESERSLYFYALEGPRGTIYKSQFEEGVWGDPQALDIPLPDKTMISWGFSIAPNNDIYLSLASTDGSTAQKIFVAEYQDKRYLELKELTVVNDESSNAMNPYISKNQDLLFFESDRRGGYGRNDLYVSKRDKEGLWSPPENLGDQINTAVDEFGASISPDGLYLFFQTQRTTDLGFTPYWLPIDRIEVLRQD